LAASDGARAGRRILAAVRPEERLALGYAALAAGILAAAGLPISIGPMAREYGKFLLAMLAFALPLWLAAGLWRATRGRFDRRSALADLGGLARTLPALLVTLVAYTNLKSRIALLHPRLVDQALERLDAVVHFGGGDFVGWLLGFTHDPAGSRLWSYVYFYAWAALALPFGLAFARAGAPAARRLVAALVLAYAVGSLLYLAFPSLGPAFAFRPRFEHLRGTLGYDVQGSMLAAYLRLLRDPHATAVPFFGLAAMPSLHLATTVLGLFAAWRWFRPLVLPLLVWNLAIAWSALYFGWHYAIDFYVGALLAWGAWWLAGRWSGDGGIVARSDPRSEVEEDRVDEGREVGAPEPLAPAQDRPTGST